MKKVIAVLCAIVVLILGTAIGVAVSASHLSEKGLLSAGDVELALASQGIFTHQVSGDHSELSAGGVTPVIYKVGDQELLVYVFKDAMQRDQARLPFGYTEDMTQWFSDVGCWRNLAICSRQTIDPERLKVDAPRPREWARYLTQMQQNEKLHQTLKAIFNDVQTKTFQIETEKMIYTLEQTSYSMPTPYGKGMMYDNWLRCRLAGCQYKEQPPAEDMRTITSLEMNGQSWGFKSTQGEGHWDGQGIMTEPDLQGSGASLTREPESVTYRIVFERGSLHDEAALTVELGGGDR